MERTTIHLEKPILEKIRERAHRQHRTLRETIRELLIAGLARSEKKHKRLPSVPSMNLGPERVDISSRARLYEMWDQD